MGIFAILGMCYKPVSKCKIEIKAITYDNWNDSSILNAPLMPWVLYEQTKMQKLYAASDRYAIVTVKLQLRDSFFL